MFLRFDFIPHIYNTFLNFLAPFRKIGKKKISSKHRKIQNFYLHDERNQTGNIAP